MIQEKQKAGRLTLAVLGAVLAFYLFLAWSVPYGAVDDYQWGLDQGVRWWLYGLLNARYGANLCAMLMCHFQAAKVLLMGGGMFAIPFFMAALACRGERERFLPAFFLCNVLIFFMPAIMWVDCYGWVSGFATYGVSVAVFLGFLLLTRRTHEKRDRLKLRSFALFAVALFMGLFVETQTITFLCVTLVLAVYAAFWDKELRLPFWAAFAGSALAAVVMFSHGVLAELLSNGTAFHGLRNLTFEPGSGIFAIGKSILKWYLQRLLPIALLRGPHLAVPMAIVIAVGFWNSRCRVLSVLGALPLWTHSLLWKTNDYMSPSHVFAACLCWALVLAALLACEGGWALKLRRGLLFLVAPMDLLPLAATNTLGHRFYLLPMVILILLAADVSAPALSRTVEAWDLRLPGGRELRLSCRLGLWLLGPLLAVFLVLWGYRGSVIGGCNVLRAQLIEQAVAAGEKEIVLPADRYGGVAWLGRNPPEAEYANYYRWFCGIPEDVTLICLPNGSYEVWPNYTEAQWEARWVFPPYQGEFVSSLPE